MSERLLLSALGSLVLVACSINSAEKLEVELKRPPENSQETFLLEPLAEHEIVSFQSRQYATTKVNYSTSEEVVFSGAAGNGVESLFIRHECPDISKSFTSEIYAANFLLDGSWRWSYVARKGDNLCYGGNEIRVSHATIAGKQENVLLYLDFFSNVGEISEETRKRIENVARYETGLFDHIEKIASDTEVHFIVKIDDPVYRDFCKEYFKKYYEAPEPPVSLERVGKDSHIPNGPIIRPLLKINENGTKSPVLDFLYENGQQAPPEVASAPCGSDIDVYFLRKDRIIVDFGQIGESIRQVYLWDGTSWRSLKDLVPIHNYAAIGAVNRENFVIKEVGPYCCESTYPTVPGSWSSFIIDVDSLKILDVLYREGYPFYLNYPF